MKLGMSLTAMVVAFGVGAPVLAQTGNDTQTRMNLERCQIIADPGLKARCMDEARNTMGAGRHLQDRRRPDQPVVNPNMPPQDRRTR